MRRLIRDRKLRAMHAYELASPAERAMLWPDLARKWPRLFPQIPDAQKASVAAQFQHIAALPAAVSP